MIMACIISILTCIENLLTVSELSKLCLTSKTFLKNVRWPKNIVVLSTGNNEQLKSLKSFLSKTSAISFTSLEGPIIMPGRSDLKSFICSNGFSIQFEESLLRNLLKLREIYIDETFTMIERDFDHVFDACLSCFSLNIIDICFREWSWLDDSKIFELASRENTEKIRLRFNCPDSERKFTLVKHISMFSKLVAFGRKGNKKDILLF